VETAPERSAIPTKADRSASASVMQQPYSEARENDIGMTRAERTAASIPRRSAAHGLSRRVPSRSSVPARGGAETPRLAGAPRRFQARDPVRIIGSIAAGVNSVLRIASGKDQRSFAGSPVAVNRYRISGTICRWPTPSFIKLFACHRPRGQTKIYPCDADCASGMLPLNRDPRSAKCLS
jgi:hypothetical protein